MPRAKSKTPKTGVKKNISRLNINGLAGRMLYLPPPKGKNKNILLIYGHHASLERMLGLAENLNQYGAVTMPDLPGFGGMNSFYKIGQKPTIDNLADYLATFVKLRFKNQKITIIAMSFGFAVVTRMLQKYPEIARNSNLVVSIVGFAHKDDFKFKKRVYWTLLMTSKAFSGKVSSLVCRHLLLRPVFIKSAYRLVADKHSKLKDADELERSKRIAFEIGLWHRNDVRTYMFTSQQMLTVDLTGCPVDLPVYHVSVSGDRYLNNRAVTGHLKMIFNKVYSIKSRLPAHAPTVLASAAEAGPFIPAKVRAQLAKS